MKKPSDRYRESIKEADQVYYDAEAGMTADEWQALKTNALSRFITECEKEEDNEKR